MERGYFLGFKILAEHGMIEAIRVGYLRQIINTDTNSTLEALCFRLS